MVTKLKEFFLQHFGKKRYYIACAIPRRSDCDYGVKCQSGDWCHCMEIFETDSKAYRSKYSTVELYLTYASAQNALKKIKEATLKKEKEE